ncbi:MAG: phosphoribosylamine--glycine ligase, partial [Chitinimonas sp.]|nr:phosphoribosylamine--glycine ligase [Chitinimonas sp.]
MNVLVIGSGGREHALAWKIAQSSRVSKVFVAPGNPGTAREAGLTNVAITSIPELVAFAQSENVGLTVVGPEAPLAAGVVDAFREAGLKIFGPTRAAAQLESSKDFAKAFMIRHGIPTAQYRTFADATEAHAYVEGRGAPIVIKADGLAAGKGVIVAMTLAEAHAAIDSMLLDNKMGDAGARVVIEDFLKGEEASFIVMVDGRHVLALASSQDHKRLKENDEGPNTGGMGAFSPAPVVTP